MIDQAVNAISSFAIVSAVCCFGYRYRREHGSIGERLLRLNSSRHHRLSKHRKAERYIAERLYDEILLVRQHHLTSFSSAPNIVLVFLSINISYQLFAERKIIFFVNESWAFEHILASITCSVLSTNNLSYHLERMSCEYMLSKIIMSFRNHPEHTHTHKSKPFDINAYFGVG